MTVIQPGASVRDSQILELLRDGAPVQRVIDIGAHRGTWSPAHVASVIAHWFATPAPKPRPKPKLVSACGTNSGYTRHLARQEAACESCKAAHAAYSAERYAARRKVDGAPVAAIWSYEPPDDEPVDVVLTRAQAKVLTAMCAGMSNGRVAIAVGRSEDTVKSHVKEIIAALGARDRTHAVTLAISGQARITITKIRKAS